MILRYINFRYLSIYLYNAREGEKVNNLLYELMVYEGEGCLCFNTIR